MLSLYRLVDTHKAISIFFSLFCTLAILFPEHTYPAPSCSTPPFISLTKKPNVMILLDNSNSFDEDFFGTAVGSFSPASKSVVARRALLDVITRNERKLRVGLMAYELKQVRAAFLYNSTYFSSYDPKSYCPNPPSACVEYCRTGDQQKKAACDSGCLASNPLFDSSYFDEIITKYPIGSEPRDRYCSLVYPKANRIQNLTDPTNYIYFEKALPYYAWDDQGNGFCYSNGPDYNPNEGDPLDWYDCFLVKRGTSDGSYTGSNPGGYSGYFFSDMFMPSDSDLALGFKDFGRRTSWTRVGRTWYSDKSSGKGFIYVRVDDLVVGDSPTPTSTRLLQKLNPPADEAAYMNMTTGLDGQPCASVQSDADACQIINAGPTPTAGAFQTAIDYFSTPGSTPIQDTCQQNFIIFVTDGAPSVDEKGKLDTSVNLMPAVLEKIRFLRNSIALGGQHYDIKTFVLGVGLTDEDKAAVDAMAQAGGTDISGHAYYADNPAQLNEALNKIFSQVGQAVASAGAVATVSQKTSEGDIIVRGALKAYDENDPRKYLWQGHLESYWPYEGCVNFKDETLCNSIAGCAWSTPGCMAACSDQTVEAACQNISGCEWVNGACNTSLDLSLFDTCSRHFTSSDCSTAIGCKWVATSHCDGLLYSFQLPANQGRFCSDHHDHCWEAEDHLPNVLDRKIFTVINGTQQSFDSTGNLCTVGDLLALSSDPDFTSSDCTQLTNWVLGQEGWPNARNRNGWILGDIIYSTPVVVQEPSLATIPSDQATEDCGTTNCPNGCDCASDCSKKCFFCYRDCQATRKRMIYVGGNDGMLHAFVGGVWWQDPLNQASHWIYDPNEPNNKCNNQNCDGKELIGKELWAYVPSNLLPQLKELARKSYGTIDGCTHLSMVDLSPQSWDVFIDPTGSGTDRQWRTVLLGGERGGGDVYFAIDVTDPDNPIVLWEYSVFRNMAQMNSSDGGATYFAEFPYRDKAVYDQVGTLPMSWTPPAAGRVQIPNGVGFSVSDTAFPLSDGTPPVGTRTLFAGDLSGWFAWIGGGPRIFDLGILPASLTDAQKIASLKPNFLMVDIEKGINIFQYNWPLIQSLISPTPWPDVQVGGNHIPYSMTGPVAISVFLNDLENQLTTDGNVHSVYLGDLNGNFYSFKFNMGLANNNGVAIDIHQTKSTLDAAGNNHYRSNHQPLSVTPTAALDPDNHLRLYLGAGKFENVDGTSTDDKTDQAIMSFYSLKTSLQLQGVSPRGFVRQQSNDPATFSASAGTSNGFSLNGFGITVNAGCTSSSFNASSTWVKSDGTPDCGEADCSASCWTCISDLNFPGERVVDSALVAGGLVFFTSFVPETDACESGGKAFLYVVDYLCRDLSTQNPFEQAGFNLQNTVQGVTQLGQYAKITKDTQIAGYVAMIGSGMPSRPVLDSSGQYLLIQTSDAAVRRVRVDLSLRSMQLRGWLEQGVE